MLTLGVLFSMVGAFGWRVWRAVKRADSLRQ
jgi:predicted negative regulator of RcsB-dependent stress response